mgnify:CR=1 FL=1
MPDGADLRRLHAHDEPGSGLPVGGRVDHDRADHAPFRRRQRDLRFARDRRQGHDPHKTFTVSGGWLSRGATARLNFKMALMGRINGAEGGLYATFNDPLLPSAAALDTTSAAYPFSNGQPAQVPLPAGGVLNLTAFGGLALLKRAGRARRTA